MKNINYGQPRFGGVKQLRVDPTPPKDIKPIEPLMSEMHDYCLAWSPHKEELCKEFLLGECYGCPAFDEEGMEQDEYDEQCDRRD